MISDEDAEKFGEIDLSKIATGQGRKAITITVPEQIMLQPGWLEEHGFSSADLPEYLKKRIAEGLIG